VLTGEPPLTPAKIPADLDAVLARAWKLTEKTPGHLQRNEALFLGILAACVPASGTIVEIGSFKGRWTVMLATVAAHYGGGPVVAIDPHNSPILLNHTGGTEASSYKEFLHSIQSSGVSEHVEPRVAYSTEVAKDWNRPIRILWIDGDHTLEGVRADVAGFLRFVVPGGVIAFHDALNTFSGPIKVFADQFLASDQFGAAGFVHSIAWTQYRPQDGARFKREKAKLRRAASRLIPFVEKDEELHGMRKRLFKLNRYRVPHSAMDAPQWVKSLEHS
jgi:hypothetical protein